MIHKKPSAIEKQTEYFQYSFEDLYGEKFSLKINANQTGAMLLEKQYRSKGIFTKERFSKFLKEQGFKVK